MDRAIGAMRRPVIAWTALLSSAGVAFVDGLVAVVVNAVALLGVERARPVTTRAIGGKKRAVGRYTVGAIAARRRTTTGCAFGGVVGSAFRAICWNTVRSRHAGAVNTVADRLRRAGWALVAHVVFVGVVVAIVVDSIARFGCRSARGDIAFDGIITVADNGTRPCTGTKADGTGSTDIITFVDRAVAIVVDAVALLCAGNAGRRRVAIRDILREELAVC